MTIAAILLTLSTSWSQTTLHLVTGSAAVGVLLWGRKRLRKTTLMAPWCWTMGSMLTLVLSELAVAILAKKADESSLSLLRYAAAMTTFCPQMAVLGAKRPQDRAWQWIVLSLLIVLWLPAAQWGLFHAGELLNLATPWAGLLVILMFVGLINYLPTRYWLSSGLVFFGQLGLLLPFLCENSAQWPVRSVGYLLLAVAAVLVVSGVPRSRKAHHPLDRLWIDFRDQFGVVWGLRIAQRVRAESVKYDWKVELDWTGLHPKGDPAELSTEAENGVRKILRSLLLRFVSPEWIAARLPEQ